MTILKKEELTHLQNDYASNFYFVIEEVLDDSECLELVDLLIEHGKVRDTSLYDEDGSVDENKESNALSSSTWLYDHEESGNSKMKEYLEGFHDLMNDLNSHTYKFDFNGISPLVSLNVMQVDGGISFHRDMASGLTSTIKLVAIIGLNDDYEGGDFVVFGDAEKSATADNANEGVTRIRIPKGGCVIIPAHVIHAVDKVESGIRQTAVMSLEGAPFK